MKRLKGRRRRLVVYLTVSTTVFLVVSPGIALADEIVDPVDATVTVDPTTVDATVTDPVPDATVTDPVPDATVTDPVPDATVTDPVPDATVTDPVPDATVVDPVSEPASGPTPETATDSFPEVTTDPITDVVTDSSTDEVAGPSPETALEPFPEVVTDPITDVVTDPITDEVAGPSPETALEPFPEVVTDPITDEVAGPAPETALEPFPEVVTDPITDVVTDPITDVVTDPITDVVTDPITDVVTDPITDVVTDPITDVVADPIVEPVADPLPELVTDPLPELVSEPIPAPIVVSPEVVAPITLDETPIAVTATTELFFSDEGPIARITSEELPQKLQDDPFTAPQHEGTTLTSTAIVLMSSIAATPSKAGSVQVDDPSSCSGLGSAPCGVRNSPNDPGSFVQSIAELLRQLALTGSGALDLLKLALILAIVGAFAIWGTRRRPVVSVVEPKRTLRSGDLLHRHHRVMANGSDRPGEWITSPHVVVRQRPTRRIPVATPQLGAPASGGSAARRPGGASFVAGSVARVSICPTTRDRAVAALVPALRGNGR
jgi:hypothetical protein